jgi:hypothetical protein
LQKILELASAVEDELGISQEILYVWAEWSKTDQESEQGHHLANGTKPENRTHMLIRFDK